MKESELKYLGTTTYKIRFWEKGKKKTKYYENERHAIKKFKQHKFGDSFMWVLISDSWQPYRLPFKI